MKRIVKLTESDLTRIVRKVINEQWWLNLGRYGSHETNTGAGWDVGFATQDTNSLMRDLSEEERFKMLFDWAKTWPSTAADWNSIKSYATNMKNEMSGMGSGNVLSYLPKFNTKAKFAALCKNFVYDGSNLYNWFDGESTIGWDDIMGAIPNEIKKGVPTMTMKDNKLYA
jgi:hypothetical protein